LDDGGNLQQQQQQQQQPTILSAPQQQQQQPPLYQPHGQQQRNQRHQQGRQQHQQHQQSRLGPIGSAAQGDSRGNQQMRLSKMAAQPGGPLAPPAPAPAPAAPPAPAPAPAPRVPPPEPPESTFLFEMANPGLVTFEYDNVMMAAMESGRVSVSSSVWQQVKRGSHVVCKLLDAKDSGEVEVTRAATGGRQTVDLPGPPPPAAVVNPTPEDLLGVPRVAEAVQTAAEFGALVKAEVAVGRSAYLVPFDFTQEALGMAELVQLLHTKQIHYIFAKGVTQSCQVDALAEDLRSHGWTGDPRATAISVTFADRQTVEMTIEQGGVLKAAPGTSAELRGRTACLTLLPDGRVEMPPAEAETKDVRALDAQTIVEQRNHLGDMLAHGECGWDAKIASHLKVTHSNGQPPSVQTDRSAACFRHRLDMPNSAPEALQCQTSEAFPVLSGVVICVGSPCDVRYLLSEMPPGEDAPGPVVDAAGQMACLHAGLKEATRAVAAATAAEVAEVAQIESSVPTTFDELATYVQAGRVLWAGEALGDVVFRRVQKAGEAVLKRVRWKPSLHCQKAEVALRKLTDCMRPSLENPIDEMLTAAKPLFNGPAPAKTVMAELWHTLAVWCIKEVRAAGQSGM
jgi:hypothetical protein